MDKPILSDPSIFPSEEVLSSALGRAYKVYVSLFEALKDRVPEAEAAWKYYNDGKSWLRKASKKSLTLFWLSVSKGQFRVTMYYKTAADKAIEVSTLPEALKQQYLDTQDKRFHGVTLELRTGSDVRTFSEMLEIKLLTK